MLVITQYLRQRYETILSFLQNKNFLDQRVLRQKILSFSQNVQLILGNREKYYWISFFKVRRQIVNL
jgi:hypothetical protein